MPDSVKSPRLSRLAIILAVVLVLGAALFAFWRYKTVWQYELSSNDAYIHADYVNIAPEVSGYIVHNAVESNKAVKAGDLLAKIDPVPYEAAVRQAEAAIAQADANIKEITTELAAQPALIEEAQANVASSEAAAKFAQENMNRLSTLTQKGFSSEQSSQLGETNLQEAQGKLQLSRAALAAAQRRIPTLNAQLASAQAALKQSQAVLTTAQFNLGRTELRAPLDGVVGNNALRMGMLARQGGQLLAIVPLHKVYIIANYKETDLAQVKPGQPVSISVDAFSNQQLHGIVESIAPAAGQTFALLPPDNATGNFTKIVQRVPVRIAIDPNDPLIGRLRPGMSVTTTIKTNAESAKANPAIGN